MTGLELPAALLAGAGIFAGGYTLGKWYGEARGYLHGLLDEYDVDEVPRP